MSRAHRCRPSWRLHTLLALGVAAACVDRSSEPDQQQRHLRCTWISFQGTDADGHFHYGYTNDKLGHTPQVCTCSTEQEAGDFSPGGYRDGYINELGYEECTRISMAEGYIDDNCDQKLERGDFGLLYGDPPAPLNEGEDKQNPLCGESEGQGCS
jgi:hypothetical protein